MEPVFFVMAIMGCGDGQQQCAEARVVPARYETMAQCRAALPEQLARNSDVPFPVIGADCRSSGVRMVKAQAKTPRG